MYHQREFDFGSTLLGALGSSIKYPRSISHPSDKSYICRLFYKKTFLKSALLVNLFGRHVYGMFGH